MSRATLRWTLAVFAAGLLIGDTTFAGRGGRGGGHVSRGGARTSVNRSANFNRDFDRNVNRDVNRNVNRDVNRNIDRNVDVNRNIDVHRDLDWDRDIDVDVDHHYGGWGYGCCYHPVATAAAATAAAVTTAAVVGSVVNTLPSSCEAVNVNGFTYQHCGSAWYQPQFSGTSVNYVVINPPR